MTELWGKTSKNGRKKVFLDWNFRLKAGGLGFLGWMFVQDSNGLSSMNITGQNIVNIELIIIALITRFNQ